MDGYILEQVENEKDLGVIIDNDLKFHAQTSASVKKSKPNSWINKEDCKDKK